MTFLKRLSIILAASAALATAPANAERYVASNVSIFERVTVGFVDVTPITILFEDRCVNQRLCFRSDELIISAVLHDAQGLTEVILRLGQPVQVPGGLLVLTDAGTPGVPYGAINVEKYKLELVYIPVE